MNNPVMTLVNAMLSGGDPMALIQRMAGQDPQIAQASQLIRGKTPQQLEQMARNMAAERGTTIEDIAQSIGLQIPRSR